MAIAFGTKQTYTTPGGGNKAFYDYSCALDSTHFVVAWRDTNDSDQGKCVVGTISGTTVTYGSIVTFNSADTRNPSICKIDSTHFAIAFRDTGDSGKGKAMIATVASGDVITFGSEYTFAAGTVNNPDIKLLDSTHLVVSYDDLTNTDGSAIVGTISSTDVISFGTRVAFKSTDINRSKIAILDSTHFAVVFKGASNEYVKAIIGVVSSGTTITFGSEVAVLGTNSNSADIATIDSTHFLLGYTDNNAGVISGNVCSVASGDVITVGTKYSAGSNINSEVTVRLLSSTTFFFSGIVSATISVITGSLASSVITYDTAVIADSGSNDYVAADMLTASSIVVTYSNSDSSPIGTAKIGTTTVTYDVTVQSKARIKIANNDKTVSSKARIKVGQSQTVTAKARLYYLGINTTISAKAYIGVPISVTVQARADIKNTISKTVQAKAAIFNTIATTVQAKARIKLLVAQTISAKATINTLVTKTIQAKAAIKAQEIGIITGINNNTSVVVGIRL